MKARAISLVIKWDMSLQIFCTHGRECLRVYIAPEHVLEHEMRSRDAIQRTTRFERRYAPDKASCAAAMRMYISLVQCDSAYRVFGLNHFFRRVIVSIVSYNRRDLIGKCSTGKKWPGHFLVLFRTRTSRFRNKNSSSD